MKLLVCCINSLSNILEICTYKLNINSSVILNNTASPVPVAHYVMSGKVAYYPEDQHGIINFNNHIKVPEYLDIRNVVDHNIDILGFHWPGEVSKTG